MALLEFSVALQSPNRYHFYKLGRVARIRTGEFKPPFVAASVSDSFGSIMVLQLNGEQREIPDGLSLAGLVEWLELPADRVAIERNLEVVKRVNWTETRLESGDRLEIVRMVGGGRPIDLRRGDCPCLPL